MEGAPTPLIRRGCSLPRLGIDTHPLPFPPTVATFWSPKPDYSTLRLEGGKVPFPGNWHYLLLTNGSGQAAVRGGIRPSSSPNSALFRSRLTEYSRLSIPPLPSSLPPCLMSAAIDLHQDKMKSSAVHVTKL